MNLQKLNEVETYTNLWTKIKNKFHKKDKVSKESMNEDKEETENVISESSINDLNLDKDEKKESHSQDIDDSNKEIRQIDLILLFHILIKHKFAYLILLPIVIILSSLYIVKQPRTYTTVTTMAPEIAEVNSNNGGSLNSIAQSLGINLDNMQNMDAISPLLYPELMKDNGFVTGLFNILIQTSNSDSVQTFYNYMRYGQKVSWFDQQKGKLMSLLQPDSKDSTSTHSDNNKAFDPYDLSKTDADIADAIRGSVSIDVDKKTGIISINVVSQDPLASKIIADSVRGRLQNFITDYRTSKAKRDVEYYEKLTKEARTEYEEIRRKYAATADENVDVIMESEKSKIEDLENTMQLDYNRYTVLSNQLDAARAKLRQYTPAFTVIQGASVPVKPSGPKRMFFVLVMTIITIIVVSIYAIIRERKSL